MTVTGPRSPIVRALLVLLLAITAIGAGPLGPLAPPAGAQATEPCSLGLTQATSEPFDMPPGARYILHAISSGRRPSGNTQVIFHVDLKAGGTFNRSEMFLHQILFSTDPNSIRHSRGVTQPRYVPTTPPGPFTLTIRSDNGAPLPDYMTVTAWIEVIVPDGTCPVSSGDDDGEGNGGGGGDDGEAGDPVSTSTGNLFYRLPVASDQAAWAPTHNARDKWKVTDLHGRRGVFGDKWTSLLDARSVALPRYSTDPFPFLHLRMPTGQTFVASGSATNAWTPPDDLYATSLVRDPATGVQTWTFRSGAVWTFNARGFLTSTDDGLGRRIEITRATTGMPTRLVTRHDGVLGDAWTFVDTGALGLVDEVVGPYDADLPTPPADAVRTQLAYSGTRLASVSVPVTATGTAPLRESYGYSGSSRLATVTQHPGSGSPDVTVLTVGYDAFDRVTSQTNALGEVDVFAYTRAGEEWITTVEHRDGPAIETVTYRHDADLRLIEVEDPYDETLTWAWDGARPAEGTRRGGGEATATWDAGGRLEQASLPDADVAGQQAGAVEATYCGPDDPRPVDVTDAAGVVTRTWWTTGTDPYACDPGRLVPAKVTTALGTAQAADSTFTATDGLVTSATDPDGVVTTMTWEAGRGLLLSSTDFPDGPANPGRTTYRGYDGAGRQTVERDPGGVETWWVRDGDGRVVQQVGPVAVSRTCGPTSCSFGTTPPAGPTRSWSYDGTGGLRTTTDEAGEVTTRAVTYPTGGGRVETVTAPPHGDDVTDPLSQVATVTTSTYDRFDRLTTVTMGDPATPASLATTTYTYDPLGRLRQMSQDVGGGQPDLVESYAYDADGNQTHVVHGPDPEDLDRAQAVQRYDLRGRLVEEWGPTGDTTAPTSVGGPGVTAVRQHRQWVYDEADRLLATIVGDGAEQQTTYRRYDVAGRLRYVIVDRDGDQVAPASPLGDPTDADDGVTEYTYTAGGRLHQIIAPPVNNLEFDWIAGNQANKNPTTRVYDDAGQLVSTTNPNGKVTTRKWDARGQLERVTVPGGYWTEYGYDDAGRTTRVTNPSPTGTGTVDVLTGYDPRGLRTTETDAHPSGGATPPTRTWTYHDDGTLASTTNPLGGPTATVRYAYDARGNRTGRASWTQASPTATPHEVVDTWGYDQADRQVSEQLAGAAGPTTTAYDPVMGLPVEVVQPSGRVETTTYWNSGLVRSVTTTKPADAHGPTDTHRACTWFDTVGQRRHTLDDDLAGAACVEGDTTAETWTPAGTRHRVYAPATALTPTGVDETLTYSWGLDGRLRQITLPDGEHQRWSYGRSGQVVSVIRPGHGSIADYTYDGHGRLRSESTRAGDVTRTWTLPANGAPHPTTMVETATGDATRTTTYTYGADGRIDTETTGGRVLDWAYDGAGQVTGRTDSGGADHAYAYGPRGLRLTETVDGTTRSSTYDDGARLVSSSDPTGTTTYGYDADGRRVDVTAPGAAAPLHTTYDARGLPVEIDLTATDVEERTYDAHRRLVEIAEGGTTTQAHVWDPVHPTWQPIVVRDPSGFQRVEHAAHGVVSSRDDSGPVTSFRQDRQGSTTTSVALPSAPAVYAPFGAGGDPDLVAGYRGEQVHAGLIHLRNRDLDPATGTFTTRDPLDGVVGTPTETNPYHYADNDPANKEDPLGLSPTDDSVDDGPDAGDIVCGAVQVVGGIGVDKGLVPVRVWGVGIRPPTYNPGTATAAGVVCVTLGYAADQLTDMGSALNDAGAPSGGGPGGGAGSGGGGGGGGSAGGGGGGPVGGPAGPGGPSGPGGPGGPGGGGPGGPRPPDTTCTPTMRCVLLDTSAIFAMDMARARVQPGETPVVSEQVVTEVADVSTRPGKEHFFLPDWVGVIPDSTDMGLRVEVRRVLREFGTGDDGGFEGDSIIGATALDLGIPLILRDNGLDGAVSHLGGETRHF